MSKLQPGDIVRSGTTAASKHWQLIEVSWEREDPDRNVWLMSQLHHPDIITSAEERRLTLVERPANNAHTTDNQSSARICSQKHV